MNKINENDFLSGSLPEYACGAGTEPVLLCPSHAGELAVIYSVNRLAARGIRARCFSPVILLPPGTQEETLRDLMRQICRASCNNGVGIGEVRAEVTDAVIRPVLSVTGVGKVKRDALITTSGAKPGMDLIATKWIGLEGTSIIAAEKKDELLQKFPADFVERAIGFNSMLSVVQDGLIAAGAGAAAMHDVTEGGIFGALWEMGTASDVGLSVDIEKIPIKQESVEICDYFDIDPYCLISSGSMLIAAWNGLRVVDALENAGIHAAVIGRTDDGAARLSPAG